jgi:hypothetical protein
MPVRETLAAMDRTTGPPRYSIIANAEPNISDALVQSDKTGAPINSASNGSLTQDDKNVKFSFAGPKARMADHDALARAEQMERDGIAAEEIRKNTGWFRGMENMWRFEIDDSGMKFDPAFRLGEASKRFDNAYKILEKYMTPEFDKELTRYFRIQADKGAVAAAQECPALFTRSNSEDIIEYIEASNAYTKAANGQTLGELEQFIEHNELFNNYPQLRGIIVSFENLGGGGGYYKHSEKLIA